MDIGEQDATKRDSKQQLLTDTYNSHPSAP